MPYFIIWSLCMKYLVHHEVYCLSWSCLLSHNIPYLIYLNKMSLTLKRACTAKGYCSLSVCRSVGLSARFLSNRGFGRYQTLICRYVQRALGAARVKEQRVYGGRLNVQCVFLVQAESGGYQPWMCGYRYEERLAQQESGAALSQSSMYLSGQLLYKVCIS